MSATDFFFFVLAEHTSVLHMNSTGLDASLEHFEMNTNDAYGTNTTEIATGNVAHTTEDTIPATQNVPASVWVWVVNSDMWVAKLSARWVGMSLRAN